MSQQQSLHSLNLQALVGSGGLVQEQILLQKLERLAPECVGLQSDLMVNLQVKAELRTGAAGQLDTWMHLHASTCVPLICQRCMGPVEVPLQVRQWYRFVATEDIAMAEDDESEEDLLVMAPQFDLLALLEDELLMALPLVPMHDECPTPPVLSAGFIEPADEGAGGAEKPNPFAALAQLKKK